MTLDKFIKDLSEVIDSLRRNGSPYNSPSSVDYNTTEIKLVSVDDWGHLHEIDIESILAMNFDPIDPNNPSPQVKFPCLLRICIVPTGITAQNHGIIYP